MFEHRLPRIHAGSVLQPIFKVHVSNNSVAHELRDISLLVQEAISYASAFTYLPVSSMVTGHEE
jgi:hypothetical protein